VGGRNPLGLFIPVVCLGGVFQKFGVLFFMQDAISSPSGVTPALMGMLFLPVPLTALVLFLWPIKRPHVNIAVVYFVLALLFFSRLHAGHALFLTVCLGTWFSIATNSSMESMESSWIRRTNTIMLVSVISAEFVGAAAISLNLRLIPLLGVVSLAFGLITLRFCNGASPQKKIRPAVGFGSLVLPQLLKAAPLMFVYLTAGLVEAVTLKRISSAGFGAETYACLMWGHSVASVFGACATLPENNFGKITALWLGALSMVFFGNMAVVSCGYVLVGALGILMAKEFRISLISSSENVAVFSALSSFVLALCSAVGAIAGASMA
jgi:hypothetical protein